MPMGKLSLPRSSRYFCVRFFYENSSFKFLEKVSKEEEMFTQKNRRRRRQVRRQLFPTCYELITTFGGRIATSRNRGRPTEFSSKTNLNEKKLIKFQREKIDLKKRLFNGGGRRSQSQTSKRNRLIIGHSWRAGCGMCNGAESGGKLIHWPHIQCQSLHYGDWQHNYQCQQRQTGWANEQSTYLDVYGHSRLSDIFLLIF